MNAACATIDRASNKLSIRSTLETAPHKMDHKIIVRLMYRTAGLQANQSYRENGIARSGGHREVAEGYGVRFTMHTQIHGHWFNNEAAARQYFTRLTTGE